MGILDRKSGYPYWTNWTKVVSMIDRVDIGGR